jgi:uncharacterized membrane protein
MNPFPRGLRHLFSLPGAVARAFPAATLSSIEDAIRESEKLHGGEIRFAVEAALDPLPLLRGQSARQRAIQAFAELGVWDTEHNNGVLLYLLLADRDVEIVADRGFNAKVSADQWEQVCRAIESALAAGRYEAAVVEGVRRIAGLIARHFPARSREPNELPDKPALL